jgi:hypothetical protein
MSEADRQLLARLEKEHADKQRHRRRRDSVRFAAAISDPHSAPRVATSRPTYAYVQTATHFPINSMSSTPTTDTAFDWSPLGEQRARELGEAAGCSELQLRYGVARLQGASQTAAARIAGYEGSGDALRRAGYAACRSTGVQNFLELAAIHMPESAAISAREIDAKVAKLIRSQDKRGAQSHGAARRSRGRTGVCRNSRRFVTRR